MAANKVGQNKWSEALQNCPAIQKRVLIAVDVSASLKDARTLYGLPAALGYGQVIEAIRNHTLLNNLSVVAVDWRGAWNKVLGLVYPKNPHGDLLPNDMVLTEGIYEYGPRYSDIDHLARWFMSAGCGVPAVNMCLPFNYAEERKIKADVFVLLTDTKMITGNLPDSAWHQYVKVMGIQPRVANLSISKPAWTQDPKTGQKHDHVWISPFFANFTADTLPSMFTYINGNPQDDINV